MADTKTVEPVVVTEATFPAEVLQSTTPVLLDCWASWCAPCQSMLPVVHALAGELAGQVKVAKLNVDENPAITKKLGIKSIPTFLLYKDGNLVDQMQGTAPKDQLKTTVLAKLQIK